MQTLRTRKVFFLDVLAQISVTKWTVNQNKSSIIKLDVLSKGSHLCMQGESDEKKKRSFVPWTYCYLVTVTWPECRCNCHFTFSFIYPLTFSGCIAHYGRTRNFSLPAMSATDGRQALHRSWMHRTPVCGSGAKNSTVGLLIVKWIQLLLVFSWGFQPPQGVINLDPAF